jgi:hypothetical protein
LRMDPPSTYGVFYVWQDLVPLQGGLVLLNLFFEKV